MTTESEWAWIAGIIEGEGCLRLHQRRTCKTPDGSITVNMTDGDVISKLQRLSGFGIVSGPHKRGRDHYKPNWNWTVCKAVEVVALLTEIRPWLGKRRGVAADKLMAVMVVKKPRSYRMTADEKRAKRRDIARAYYAANRERRNEYMKQWMRRKRALLRASQVP